jgi:hypothetical protein
MTPEVDCGWFRLSRRGQNVVTLWPDSAMWRAPHDSGSNCSSGHGDHTESCQLERQTFCWKSVVEQCPDGYRRQETKSE